MEGNLIAASFTLTPDEIRRGLQHANIITSHIKQSLFQNIMALIGLILFIGNIYIEPAKISNYLFAVLCLFLMVFVWVYPAKKQKRIIDRFGNLGIFNITLSENELAYNINNDREGNVITLDRSIEMIQDEKLFLLKVSSNFVLIIPKRCFDPTQLEMAEKYLRIGTTQVNSKY